LALPVDRLGWLIRPEHGVKLLTHPNIRGGS